jgi:membrane fusion protein, multidrug efflux system
MYNEMDKLNLHTRMYWVRSVVFLLVFLAFSCGKQKGQQGMPPAGPVPVKTYKVTSQSVTGTDVYPGTVVPLKEVELRAQVTGYITDIYAKDGQKVTEGQKLYEIDRSKYKAAYQNAQAELQSAQANLEKTRTDLERYERLLEKDAIARQQVDYARAAYRTAKSQVTSAQAQITAASTDLGYSVIEAPFSGTIGISQVRIGAQVSPGQTLLNTISADDPVAVDFVVSEDEIPRFNALLKNPKPDSTFMISVGEKYDYPLPGRMVAIDRAVSRQTGTITIRLSFPNPRRDLVSGMTVNVKVLNKDIGEQVVIPFKSVTEQMGEYFVYVVSGDSVNQRNLQLGSRVKDKVVVREGLNEGETIVTEGIQKLKNGSKITGNR